MLEKNVMPNAVTLATILPACNPVGNIDLGKQLHGVSIRLLLDKNIFVSTSLVDMYSKSGSINYAENVFTKLPDKNSVTYTTMILAYGQHGMGERALSLFHSMKESRIEPDAITFIAVLSACSHSGLVDDGLQIFESMEKDFKIQPSAPHYCCVTDMLGKNSMNTLNWEKLLPRKLLEMEKAGNITGYHVLLSNIYAEEGNWVNADKVRKEMREKGLQKEVGSSWIDIGGSVARFTSKDQDHPHSDKIYEMLERLAMEMKKSLDFWNQSINLFEKGRFFLAAAHVYMVFGAIFSYSEQAKSGLVSWALWSMVSYSDSYFRKLVAAPALLVAQASSTSYAFNPDPVGVGLLVPAVEMAKRMVDRDDRLFFS
ncbi:hypothetical protein OIU77_029449 [Salix suchowensis]|uniref:Pentatricopeptide repeat-containing protein n=1 Tax=Salix suchowensis TaxID=1278906 RepID=A0ABQ9B992_9ROSI|nr:hypothetical protein OIU77_029449 [Salix suchowensis]